jgi:FHS family Na+ dependent glucose MFS transporter 1
MKQKKTITLLYYWSFISLGLIAGFLGPSLPSFAENTGSTLSQISNLFILSALGYLIGSYLSGHLLNKIPGHHIIFVSIVIMSAGMVLLPSIRSIWILVSVFFILGLAQSHLDVAENTLLIWLHGKAVPPYMNGLHFFFGLGSFLAPFIIAQSFKMTANLNAAFWIMAGIILLPAIVIMRFPSPPVPTVAAQNAEAQSKQTPAILVVLLIILFFGFVGGEVTYGNWIYTYSLEGSFGNAIQSAYLTSAFWGAFTIARLFSILLGRIISVKNLLWINLIGSIISLSLMLIWPDSKSILWVGTLGFGFFIASCFPTAMNFAEQLGAVSSKVTSLFFVSASLSGMASPWIVGQWFASQGPQIAIWVVFANLIIGLLVYSFIHVIQKRQTV